MAKPIQEVPGSHRLPGLLPYARLRRKVQSVTAAPCGWEFHRGPGLDKERSRRAAGSQ
jgi:hypothetical protein